MPAPSAMPQSRQPASPPPAAAADASGRLQDWLQAPQGQYLLQWEAACFNAAVADIFGYNAVQMGLPALDALAANRMPHRWLCLTGAPPGPPASAPVSDPAPVQPPASALAASAWPRLALAADPAALPFAADSLDLVALPHTLELSRDPRASLREVQRVLVPEGKVAIAGLNPASLWGLGQRRARLGLPAACLPGTRELVSHWRLRDWLRLLGFELDSLQFGCWRPPARSARTLARLAWLDRLGARGWPVLGAAYFIVATKRVHGARLIGPSWRAAALPVVAPAAAINRQRPAGPPPLP